MILSIWKYLHIRLHVITGNDYDKHDEDKSRRSFWRRMLSRAREHMGGGGGRLFVTHWEIKREAPTSRKRKLRRMRQRDEGWDWKEEENLVL